MTIVAALLVPGSPLPLLRPENPPWARLVHGYRAAARSLAMARPDVLLVYSTQWIAVLDELWQLRPVSAGVHVDENWHEFGELPYQINSDVPLATACVEGSSAIGISAKGVDYDQFPVDTGTIVANTYLNPHNQRHSETDFFGRFDDRLGLTERGELMHVQTFVAQATVK